MKQKTTILIILILIALIIIIFLLIKFLGLIDHRPRIPTGNIDIFEIIFGNQPENTQCNCTCNCDCNNTTQSDVKNITTAKCDKCKNNEQRNNCKQNNGQNNNNLNNITNSTSEDNPTEETGVTIYDKDTKFEENTQLNIFKQVAYHTLEGKGAPANENSYQFVIKNNNDFGINYSLEMAEENENDINMMYRLKLNGKYIAGNDEEYVKAEELNQYDRELANNVYDVYTLDWKWVESSNDTEIGEDVDSYYKLYLKIKAY